VFEVQVVRLPGRRRRVRRREVERAWPVLLVGGDQRRLVRRLDKQRVPADDPDRRPIRPDDSRDAGRVVVVFLVVERQQRRRQRVPGGVAHIQLLGHGIDVRAVAEHRAPLALTHAVVGDVGVVRLRGVRCRGDGQDSVALDDLSVRKRPGRDAVRADARADDDEAADVHTPSTDRPPNVGVGSSSPSRGLFSARRCWVCMVAAAPPAWPAVGSLAAGAGTLALARFVVRYRGRPGVTWFLGVLAAQALWCFAYGIGLFVFDPTLRLGFEIVVWIGIVWTGLTFLAFALAYTGRSDVVYAPAFTAVGAVITLLVVTNPLHGLFWTGFRLDPVFGVATVAYALQPLAYLTLGVATLAVVAGVVLLVDTFLNYGPLYRRETAAVAVSALPPGLALLAWAGGVGPVPQLNLAPLMFVPHVALDAYAFGRAELFERNPTTVRAAERTAIDDLVDPIVIADPAGRIVRLNAAARDVFVTGASDTAVLDRPVSSLLGVDLAFDGDADTDTIEHRVDGERRTYAVSRSPLADPSGAHVGWTVVFSDITAQERRRQQLEVLNRVLRHNLRNDAGVVHGYADFLVNRLEDDELHRMADAIERRSAALESLGEKARTVEALLDGEPRTDLSVGSLVERVVDDAGQSSPEAEIDLDVRTEVTASLRERTFEAAVENLVENAVRHHDGAGTERADGGAWAAVTVTREDGTLVVSVADDGPGIPSAELDAIEAGEETDLQHGSGLGLWVVHWASTMLGGDVTYADREPRGTVATLRSPVESADD